MTDKSTHLDHPSTTALIHFTLDVLPDDALEEVSLHLADCDPCTDRLIQLEHVDRGPAPDTHLSRDVLARLVADDLTPKAARMAQDHLQACTRCHEVERSLRSEPTQARLPAWLAKAAELGRQIGDWWDSFAAGLAAPRLQPRTMGGADALHDAVLVDEDFNETGRVQMEADAPRVRNRRLIATIRIRSEEARDRVAWLVLNLPDGIKVTFEPVALKASGNRWVAEFTVSLDDHAHDTDARKEARNYTVYLARPMSR